MVDSKFTIMQVIPHLNAGGAERTTIEINQALINAGHRSIVVSQGGHNAEKITLAGGRYFELPVDSKNPVVMAQNVTRLKKVARAEQVNLIHARSRAPAWSCLPVSRALSIPFVTTYHGAYRAGSRIKTFYNSSMVRGDHVIANSHFTKSRILATFGADHHSNADQKPLSERMSVIPRGADITQFSPQAMTRDRLRAVTRHWPIPDSVTTSTSSPVKLLLPARMSPWKGHEVAINAVKILNRAGQSPNLRLIFCGGRLNEETSFQSVSNQEGGKLERVLRKMVVDYGISELVHFVGHCEDMPAAYHGADGVLVPSTRPEAFGRVAVEAGAMAKPVIASDHGGAQETIKDGETGWLVPPNDANALATAIAKLCQMSTEGRKTLGNSAKNHVLRHYTAQNMTGSTLALYESMMSQPPFKPTDHPVEVS